MRASLATLALALLTAAPLAAHAADAAPAAATAEKPTTNKDWWPDQLDLTPLRQNENTLASPYGADFDYTKAFLSLDLKAVKADIAKVC